MGEIKEFINMYIGESDLIADSLSDITLNLTKNIQDELYPGHGVITHNLHDSIQSNVTAFNQSDLTAIIEAYTMVEYAPWVNDGHTLRNDEWWDGYHFMEKGLKKTVAMYR